MSRTHRRWRLAALIGTAATLSVANPAWADPAPPFAQLLKQTADAPRLEALDADVERAEGLSLQARARPNPTVSIYGENFAGTAPYGSFDRSETTIQFNQPIEIGGKRSARIAAGEAGLTAARARNHEGRIAYAWELTRAYAAAEIADRRIALAEDEIEEATDDLMIARAMVVAGRDSRLRQLQAETELNTMQAELETARANRIGALARLSALAGVEVPFTGISEPLLDRLVARPATGPIDPLQNAAYLAADAERKAAAQRVTVEQRRAIPDITAQIGVRRLEADRATALVAGVSIPLNIFDGNRGNVAAAEAERHGAEARAEMARLEAEAASRSALAQVDAADARALAAQTTLGTAQEAYRLSRIAYEGGKAPLSELIAARHRLGQARAVVLDANIARLEARATLARLQGLTITGEPV